MVSSAYMQTIPISNANATSATYQISGVYQPSMTISTIQP